MIWTWLKQIFFDANDENKSEADEDARITQIIQNTVEKENEEEEKIVGVVTSISNGLVEINKTLISYDNLVSLNVGALVTYKNPQNPESNIVSNLELLRNVNKQTNVNSIHSKQGVITYVDDDKILVNPDSIIIWKIDAEISFIPQPNDYVNIDIIDGILKVNPQQCKVVTDQVISWNGKFGLLKSLIKISQDVCENLYTPQVGDIVVCSVIPCLSDEYKWRSLIVAKFDKRHNRQKKIDVKTVPTFIVSIGQEKIIEVPVQNISLKPIEVKYVQIIPNLPNVILLPNPITQIEPGLCVTYRISCRGSDLGRSSFTLEFKFKTFSFHRAIKFVTVEEDQEDFPDLRDNSNGSMVFINQPRNRKSMFLRVKPKNYEIPSYLLEICAADERNTLESMSLIQEQLPELSRGLTKENYSLFFHTLLFLEELSAVHLMEKMETVAPLIKRGDYYVFTFEEETIYYHLIPGDIVMLSNPWDEDESETPAAVKVCMRRDNEIYFQFKDVFNIIGNNGAMFRMKFKSNRTCTVRIHHAIDCFLKKIGVQWLFPSIDMLEIQLGLPNNCLPRNDLNYFNKMLNIEQKEAVKNILFTKNSYSLPYLLFGPPGTGKTITLVEIVLQIIQYFPECRILFAAPSNSAVDTFCLRLISEGILDNKDLLRLTSYTYSQQGNMPVDLVSYSSVLGSANGDEETEFRYCDTDALTQYKVLAGTLSNLGVLNCLDLNSGYYTHIIIDEAGQTTEPETLIPIASMLPGSTRIVLSGDPKQLGPVIINDVAKEYGLDDSLMLRFMSLPLYSRCLDVNDNSFKPKIATMLTRNYRALSYLVNLSSNLFYNDQLIGMVPDTSREAQILDKIKTQNSAYSSSLLMVNVNGQEVASKCESNSYANLMEAARVSLIVLDLYNNGITSEQIGVITPYNQQVKVIKENFVALNAEPPKIGSVEEFQGSERDIIIISLVRTTHDECRLPFIYDPRRSNVALSRAKVMCIIVANEQTMKKSQLWARVLNRAEIADL